MNRITWLSSIFLGVFFVLSLYSRNILFYRIDTIIIPLIFTVLFCGVIYGLVFLIKKDNANLVAVLVVAGFFSWGYNAILAYIFIIVGLLCFTIKKPMSKYINIVLAFTTMSLLIVPSTITVLHGMNQQKIDKVEVGSNISNLPNIYYLIFDSYASEKVLKSIGVDNSGFMNYLKEKGFVVKDSFCNYPRTYVSTASFLNMDYVTNPESLIDCYNQVQNNELFKYFKGLGYNVVNIGSNWYQTEIIRQADENYYYKSPFFSHFTAIFTATTLFSPISQYLPQLNLAEIERRVISYQFDKIKTLDMDKPTFVFSHILTPHHSYPLFMSNGEPLIECGYLTMDGIYEEHLGYTNNQIKEVIDSIGANSIIILQSDEGIATLEFENLIKSGDVWVNKVELMKQRAGILNAYYLPDGCEIYDGISPVNSWRMIINQLFDEDYEILSDIYYYPKIYMVDSEGLPSKDFYDATEVLK